MLVKRREFKGLKSFIKVTRYFIWLFLGITIFLFAHVFWYGYDRVWNLSFGFFLALLVLTSFVSWICKGIIKKYSICKEN